MTERYTTTWIRVGLLTLPIYGLLTAWATREAQPDQTKDRAAWARFVSSPGQALLLVPAAMSTFATPAIGQAYLAGETGVMRIEFPAAMTVCFLLGLLFAFAGNILLGVAIWRSQRLPRWAGAIWILATVEFYLLGVVLGQATTGASLPTQPVGALLYAIAGGWIAWVAWRSPVPATGRLTEGRV